MAKERGVVVTTEYRGVFFGYLSGDPDNGTVTLKKARNCVFWSQSVRGFMGLAATGPDKQCKIGPAVPAITLTKVTSVIEVAPEAIKAWEAAPWSI